MHCSYCLICDTVTSPISSLSLAPPVWATGFLSVNNPGEMSPCDLVCLTTSLSLIPASEISWFLKGWFLMLLHVEQVEDCPCPLGWGKRGPLNNTFVRMRVTSGIQAGVFLATSWRKWLFDLWRIMIHTATLRSGVLCSLSCNSFPIIKCCVFLYIFSQAST